MAAVFNCKPISHISVSGSDIHPWKVRPFPSHTAINRPYICLIPLTGCIIDGKTKIHTNWIHIIYLNVLWDLKRVQGDFPAKRPDTSDILPLSAVLGYCGPTMVHRACQGCIATWHRGIEVAHSITCIIIIIRQLAHA